jgi:hypothetical protein
MLWTIELVDFSYGPRLNSAQILILIFFFYQRLYQIVSFFYV